VTLDLGADPNACLTLSAALDLRGTASWTAETLALGGSHAGAPPAIYWRAPKDSDSAYYTRGGDPARVTRMLGVLRDLAEGGLARANVGSDDDRRALANLVRPMLGKDAHTVVAAGNAAPAAPAKPKDKANPQDAARNVMNAALGWYLVGIDEGPDAMSKWLKDFVGVYNRPSIRDALKKRLGRDADVLPTLKLVAAPAKLGRGALDVEIKVEGPVKRKGDGEKKGKGDKVSLAMHVLLMADGKNTWVAVGVDRDALVSRLLAARSGAPRRGHDRVAGEPRAAQVGQGRVERLRHARGAHQGAAQPGRRGDRRPRAALPGARDAQARALHAAARGGAARARQPPQQGRDADVLPPHGRRRRRPARAARFLRAEGIRRGPRLHPRHRRAHGGRRPAGPSAPDAVESVCLRTTRAPAAHPGPVRRLPRIRVRAGKEGEIHG
jgi:hypothetical protein